jgi:uncharacterized SAM-binding protein YcdF (DUF218 family)
MTFTVNYGDQPQRALSRSTVARVFSRSIGAVLACIGAMQLLVTFTPVLSPWITWLTGNRWDKPTGDILIVLGGDGVNAGGSLGQSTYWRCVYTVDIWRTARFRTLIVSGDETTVRTMADYMASQGIPLSAIKLEMNSGNTYENVVNSVRMVRGAESRFAILSSDIQMRRAYACFRKLGMRPLCIPAPDASKRFNSPLARWTVFMEVCVETAKLARYKLLGYV